jgi:DNA-binding transcriptional ArsR family regulator
MSTARLYGEQAGLLKAIAHPTRLRILDILSQGECCVCHLTAVLRQRQPCVSQHLMVLRENGLVLDRKDGVMVYYRLAEPQVATVLAATRGLQRLSEGGGQEWQVPASPVVGCTCPKCTQLIA